MTPNQFWNEDPDLLWAYWDAYKLRQKEMVNTDNINAYNQGFYILLAIRDALQDKNGKRIYPTKPIPLNSETKPLPKEDVDIIRKHKFMEMQNVIMSKYKK